MFGILNTFSKPTVLSYARNRNPRVYLGQQLFPINPVNSLSFEYFKDANILPVMASIQAYGAEAQIGGRDGAAQVKGEIPTIKRKIPLSGRALIALRREGAGDNEIVSKQLYADLDNMIDAVMNRIEKMRMDAVAYGQMTIVENGVKMDVDYGVPAGNKETLDAANTSNGYWTYANAEPISQIQQWVDAVVNSCGIRPEVALTTNSVVSLLLGNSQIRKMIYGDNGGTRAVSLSELNALLQKMELPIIQTNDMKVRVQAENGTLTTVNMFPTTRFVLLPPAQLGETLMGPTEEAMLDKEIEVKEMAGIYATVWQEMEPPSIWTKAAATAIPTFPMADAVFQAVVKAE